MGMSRSPSMSRSRRVGPETSMRGTSAASRRSFFSLKGRGDFICSGKLYWPNTLLKSLARPARRTPQRSPHGVKGQRPNWHPQNRSRELQSLRLGAIQLLRRNQSVNFQANIYWCGGGSCRVTNPRSYGSRRGSARFCLRRTGADGNASGGGCEREWYSWRGARLRNDRQAEDRKSTRLNSSDSQM